jgi:PGF-CTERM protein
VKDGSGTHVYDSGEYKVSAECNANNVKDNYNYEGATKSVVKTVRIASDALDIVVNKDTIVRGEQFTVAITGIPSTAYSVYVKNVGSDIPPKIISSQEGVLKINDYTATVTTSSGGSRNIGFATDKDTKDKKWTIRVETIPLDKYDEVSVTVKAGAVTAIAEGDGVYYLGAEVKITGTNTETDTVYFFMTGPNLPSSGGRLDAPQVAVVDGNPSSFTSTNVKDDKTYEYKWNTASLAIDSGSYSVYAVSEPRNKNSLADAQYAIVSVNLRKPFVSATVAPNTCAAGDEIHITGEAGVQTSQGLAVWIMGKNYVKYDTVTIDDDGTFDYELKSGETQNMATGQYYVVVQHPMYNDELDVYPKADGGYPYRYVVGPYPVLSAENILFTLQGPGSLQGSDAANALIVAIDNPAVDDMGASANFIIENPQINIVPIQTVTIGNEFEVRGLTNLAVDNELLIEIISSSFGPTSKNSAGGFSGFSGTTKVVRGTDAMNAFSIKVQSGNFIKDEYIVTVSSVLVDVSGSTVFNVVEFVPTPTPTPTPPPTPVTTVPTTEPTTATPTPTPMKTQTPGFGALVALVGLIGVGYLVVRKQEPEKDEN